MATVFTRPAVLVYQEYATLSTAPSTPELGVCIAGPCYQLRDYPEDKATSEVLPEYGAELLAPTGSEVAPDDVSLEIPGVRAGAVVDAASVKCALVDPVVEVAFGTADTTSNSPEITNLSINPLDEGVAVGDWLVILNGADVKMSKIREVTDTLIKIQDSTLLADDSGIAFRVQRKAASTFVSPASVSGKNITLSEVMSGGKRVVFSKFFTSFKALRTDLSSSVKEFDSVAKVLDVANGLGKFDARNPLCVGAVLALKNTTSPVKVFGVTSNDSAGYAQMRVRTSSEKGLYAVVPLTQDADILKEFADEFRDMADPDYAIANGVSQKFRVVIGSPGSLPADAILIDRNTDGAALNDEGVVVSEDRHVALSNYSGDLMALGILPGYKFVTTVGAGVTKTYSVASVLGPKEFTVDTEAEDLAGASVLFQTPTSVLVAGSADSNTTVTASELPATYNKLQDDNAQFLAAGVTAGHFIELPANPLSTSFEGELLRYEIEEVVSNQVLKIKDLGPDLSTASYELPHGASRVKVNGVLVEVPSDNTLVYRIVEALAPASDKQVNTLISEGPGYLNSRRAVVCWPDLVDVGELKDGSLPRTTVGTATPKPADSQPGYYLACTVAGLTAALPSHHGLTRMGVAGISKLYNSNRYFSDRQLTKLSNNGWMVFQQDTDDSLPFIIHGLTTDVTALQYGEFMMVKNFDYVSMVYADALEPFIGLWNINAETLGFVRTSLETVSKALQSDSRPKIGARVNDAKITQLEPNPNQPDRLIVKLEVDFPKPLNTVELHIVSL